MCKVIDLDGNTLDKKITLKYKSCSCCERDYDNEDFLIVILPEEFKIYLNDKYSQEEPFKIVLTLCPHCYKCGVLHLKSLLNFNRCESCNTIMLHDFKYASIIKRYKTRENFLHLYTIRFLFRRDILCKTCYSIFTSSICRFNYKPKFHYIPSPKHRKGLYLGVELELEHNQGIYEKCMHIVKDIRKEEDLFLKDDGSLTREGERSGVEVVSHPMKLEVHKKFKWAKLLNKWIKKGFISHNSKVCGLHIHASRRYFNSSDEFKLILFVHSQRNILAKFGRRYSSRYAFFIRLRDPKDLAYSKETDHYVALSLNESTIEFRFFRGTLIYGTFMASIEMVDALCRFTKVISSKDLLNPEISWRKFISFIKQNKDYDFLWKYIIRKKLIYPEQKLFLKRCFDKRGDTKISRIPVKFYPVKEGGE